MKYYMRLFLFPLLAALYMSACSKGSLDSSPPEPGVPYWDTLPAITLSGKNTFGCLVNGAVWVPRFRGFTFDPTRNTTPQFIKLKERDGTGRCSMECVLFDTDLEQDDDFQITFGPTFLQAFPTCDTTLNISAKFRKNNKSYSINTSLNSDNCVRITKIDTMKNIISGTFQFVLYKDGVHVNNKLIITDGRFDIRYAVE